MKKVGRFWALLLILLILLATGCATTTPDSNPGAAVDGSAVIVKDSFGREVAVPEDVQRIACLYSFAGYAVGLLGRGDDLIAVPGGLQRDVLFVEMFPAVNEAAVPRRGTINIEELLKVEPDVVIIRGDTAADEKELEKLERSGLPFIIVDYTNIEEQQQAIAIIGKAIGREEKAAVYNDYYNKIIARVEAALQDLPADQRIRVYHSENQATRTIHESSLAADWSRAAGVINVSVGEELSLINNDYYTSLEQILLWNPQVIIANENTAVDLILGDPQWAGIQAVQDRRVYQLPQGISRWGHPGSVETPLAILWTAKTVYPEFFEDVDMAKEVKDYYQRFFDYHLSDDAIQQILSGKGLREPKGES